MKQKFVSLITTAAIITTAATTAQAEEVTVHKGDTLWGYSQQYGVPVEAIKKMNNLSSDLIHPNDVLQVSPLKRVTVKKGDTLWDIARENGVAVGHLMDSNDLTSDLIHPGLNLTIYPDGDRSTKGQTNRIIDETSKTMDDQAKQTSKNKVPEETTKVKGSQAVSIKTDSETVEAPQQEVQASTPPVKKEAVSKEITVEATAYTASCKGCSGITSTGINLLENPDAKVISVDPAVIPLGSKVHVEGYGYATAADTGGAIKGNKIDVFIPDYDEAVQYGRKQVKVKIIE